MISAIVPARNEEASITRAVLSLDAQPEICEIIVVDDDSTDGTAEILTELLKQVAKLRVLQTGDLPPGWSGKNYAVSLGASAAREKWLLFVDADTVLLPGAARRALADADSHDAALVSYSPEQEMATLSERILIPFVYCRLARHFSYQRINDPHMPDAAANGQFVLVRRDTYEAVGGHREIRARVLEDVVLARRVKSAGYGIFFGPGRGIVRTRMYRSIGAMWQGWTKNLYELVGGKPSALFREVFESAPWLETLLAIAGVREAFAGRWLLLGLAMLALAAGQMRYARALGRNLYPASTIKYYIPASLLYAAVLIASAFQSARGTIAWKGRKYAAAK